MTSRRLGVLFVLACGLTGCGPQPDPVIPGVEPTDAARLEGHWTVTKVEMPPGDRGDFDVLANGAVVSVRGNLITAWWKRKPKAGYAVFEVDEKANPKRITLTESDEAGGTSPAEVTRPAATVATPGQPLPPPEKKTRPRVKLTGIYALDGDTLKVAMSAEPDSPPPTEFVPKAPAKGQTDKDATPGEKAVGVLHLSRLKELPDWAK